ncbi:aminotransferase class I/II-fold pyridoxal phosphate-dependent enzyme [uncultured Helicobacter sp.]|uniref:aminotransferase class I/II-fold pyridoxal phosphate-dependent enzyme n=1 Tax=uncultured Helicobacter sp. TaxID=175537 RepID=UPI002632F8E4|nr:aminotransferase class I/II-fold pyridoxal phosphate-dependent enzyme [uncultured Helicobacter sp.]
MKHIVIVTGYLDKVLKDYISSLDLPLDILIDFVYNDKYHCANNIYSLYSAKKYLNDDIFLFESDLVFDDSVIKQIFNATSDNFALVSRDESWMDGSVVMIDEEYRVKKIIFKDEFDFKEIDKYYKTANIYKFSKEMIQNFYIPILEDYIKNNQIEFYYERALKDIVNHGWVLKAEIVDSDLWYEIDNPNDLAISNIMFSDFSKSYEMLEKNYGGYWRFPKINDYCYLVNPYFPTPKLIEEMELMLRSLMINYPSGAKVIQTLAETMFNIKEEFLLVGNGASELIKALMTTLEGRIGFIVPTFEEYVNCAKEPVLFEVKTGLIYNASELITFISKESIKTILIIAPDNPSGFLLPKKDLEEILNWTKEHNVNVVLDESFMDFAEHYYTFLENEKLILYPNLILVKSISKSYGVAGLRLGILANSNKEILRKIQDKCSIWNINSIAEYFLQIIVKYTKEYKKSCEILIETRKNFINELRKIKQIEVFDSQSNYVLCCIKNENINVKELAIFCFKNNFLIKDCSNKIGLKSGRFFRLAVKDNHLNKELILILKNFFQDKF